MSNQSSQPRCQRDTDQPLCCFDAQGPPSIGSHSREPAEAPLGSEHHNSTRTPRGTFDGETVVAQKPALGTQRPPDRGALPTVSAHVRQANEHATFIGKPASRQRAVITFRHTNPTGYPHSQSKVLASQVENECLETRFSDLARGLFRRKSSALTPKRGAIF